MYAFGCRALLARDPAVSFHTAQRQAWRFFENAMSVHSDLLYAPTTLMAVQVLTLMVLFPILLVNSHFGH